MESYLKTLEVGIWNTVENGDTPPKFREKGEATRKLHKCHATIRHVILNSLSDGDKAKVGQYTLAKEIWVNLKKFLLKRNLHGIKACLSK